MYTVLRMFIWLQSPAPVHSCAQLVKCVMKREYDSSSKKSVKYTLRQGDRLSNSSFLMTALQSSRQACHLPSLLSVLANKSD